MLTGNKKADFNELMRLAAHERREALKRPDRHDSRISQAVRYETLAMEMMT